MGTTENHPLIHLLPVSQFRVNYPMPTDTESEENDHKLRKAYASIIGGTSIYSQW